MFVHVTVVECFLELCRRDVPEALEEAVIVEPADPGKGRQFEFYDAVPALLSTDQFGLVERVDGLGERVVIAVADAPDGAMSASVKRQLEFSVVVAA